MNNGSWLVTGAVADVLRPYQVQQLELARSALSKYRRLLMVAPTGSGKTHQIASIAKLADAAGQRVLIVATRTRVVRQIHERLVVFGVLHGVVAAALPSLRRYSARVQVCSIDTLYRRAIASERSPLPDADVVIFDEAHLATGRSRAAVLDSYPEAILIGFTATPATVSGRALNQRFDVMVPGPTSRELITLGALVPVRIFSAPVVETRELESVTKDNNTGDFAVGELAAVMSRPKLIGDVLQNWLRIAAGLPTLIFACNKSHGAALLEQFLQAGIAAELLTDDTPENERDAAIARLERGETTVLINCFLLNYGIDIHCVRVVVLARPTRSLPLYLQAVGRALRPAEGKTHAIVIDHGRVVESLGMPTDDFAWSLDRGSNVNRAAREASKKRNASEAEQPRTCPECAHMWLVTDEGPGCNVCGWAPAPKAKAVISTEAQLREIGAVDQIKQVEAERFYAEALSFYARRHPDRWREREKSGRWWAWMQTREVLKLASDKMPSRWWGLAPQPCSPEVAGKLKARAIAFARARDRARQELEGAFT